MALVVVLLLLLGHRIFTIQSFGDESSKLESDCSSSDSRLLGQMSDICMSLVPGVVTRCCEKANPKVSAKTGFSDQAIYLVDMLDMLLDASDECLDTPTARDIVKWLASDMSDPTEYCSFIQTYQTFQIDYYQVPRPPGSRLESPYTLGEKCWSAMFLQDYWERKEKDLDSALQKYGLSLGRFAVEYNKTIPMFYYACQMTINNCFRNVTWDPSYQGHCILKDAEFKVGFEYENLRHFKLVKNPFEF